LLRESDFIDLLEFKNKLLGTDEINRMLIPIFQEHNKRMESLIPKQYALNTLKKFKTTLKHIEDFLRIKYNVNDINIEKINISFINDFDFYLRTVKNCNNNSTIKYVRNFGKIVQDCYNNEWIERNPFVKYSAKINPVEKEILNKEDLEIMYNKKLPISRLDVVRDIYLFACFTGLAFVDIEKLTSENISIGIDGNKWIFTHRQKTSMRSNIPLLPIPEAIIEKYKDHPKILNSKLLLPILSNQKMNAYLKEVADVCGIKKELTFHSSRHTFATTVTLANGVPMESVSKMLGHASLRTTQQYAKILDIKVSEDMKILKDKFEIKLESKSS
jgi:site-specific recombinase XerD